MTYEEELDELIDQGYDEEEAIEIMRQRQEKEEHLAFLRFLEIHDRNRD